MPEGCWSEAAGTRSGGCDAPQHPPEVWSFLRMEVARPLGGPGLGDAWPRLEDTVVPGTSPWGKDEMYPSVSSCFGDSRRGRVPAAPWLPPAAPGWARTPAQPCVRWGRAPRSEPSQRTSRNTASHCCSSRRGRPAASRSSSVSAHQPPTPLPGSPAPALEHGKCHKCWGCAIINLPLLRQPCVSVPELSSEPDRYPCHQLPLL